MNWTNVLLAFWGLVSGILFFAYLNAASEVRKWRRLENSQARRLQDLQEHIDREDRQRRLINAFRQEPGMETVTDEVARRILDLKAENVKVTSALNEMRLEAAKYMDLYRAERFKPHRKNA
jgi:hypothetical protein